MVRALLDGRKTMTRRLSLVERSIKGAFGTLGQKNPTAWYASVWQHILPGDRLWVREAWRSGAAPDSTLRIRRRWLLFRADHQNHHGIKDWRPPIHMPRRASRLTLTVTATRIERLQEISDEDAIAEGLPPRDGFDVPAVNEFPHAAFAEGLGFAKQAKLRVGLFKCLSQIAKLNLF